MSKRVIAAAITLIAVVIVIYLINSNSRRTSDQGSSIKIGFMGPLSGGATSLGEGALAGAKLAVQEVNDKGGVNGKKVELISEDSKCSSTGGTNAANKLVSVDHVTGIVGDLCSSAAAPAAVIAQKGATPMINYCASATNITKAGDYIFRVYPSDTAQSRFAAEYVFNNLGKKSIAILSLNNEWGTSMHDGFVSRFKEIGGNVSHEDTFNDSDRDFRTQIQKLKNNNLDALVIYANVETGVAMLKQLREQGVTLPVVGGDFWDDPTLISGAGSASEGVTFTAGKVKSNEDFKKYFKDKTGTEMQICGPQAYDAAKLILNSLSGADSSTAKVKDSLSKVRDFAGASGSITFGQDREITNPEFSVKQVKNGKAEILN